MGAACPGSAFPSPPGTGNAPYQLPRACQELLSETSALQFAKIGLLEEGVASALLLKKIRLLKNVRGWRKMNHSRHPWSYHCDIKTQNC